MNLDYKNFKVEDESISNNAFISLFSFTSSIFKNTENVLISL